MKEVDNKQKEEELLANDEEERADTIDVLPFR